MEKDKIQKDNNGEFTRRHFLTISGAAAIGVGVNGRRLATFAPQKLVKGHAGQFALDVP